MTVGEKIKQRRIKMNLTVCDLAKRLGKHRATVYRYENGEIENMPMSMLVPIAEALHTTPAYLTDWKGEDVLNTSAIYLNEHEEKVIAAYRDNPDLQPAIDKLLSIPRENKF